MGALLIGNCIQTPELCRDTVDLAGIPAVMLIGTCLLLVTTIWRTDRSLVGPWRHSTLVLLFLDTEEDMRVSAQGAMKGDGEDVLAAVKEEKVRLTQTSGRWKLD
jgi:hypothetical protein